MQTDWLTLTSKSDANRPNRYFFQTLYIIRLALLSGGYAPPDPLHVVSRTYSLANGQNHEINRSIQFKIITIYGLLLSFMHPLLK